MIYAKTAKGTEVLQKRSIALPPRQRTLLLLTDGKHHAQELLQQTAGLGATAADLDALVALGLITLLSDAEPSPQPARAAPGAAPPSQFQSTLRSGPPSTLRGTTVPGADTVRINMPLEPQPSTPPAGLAALDALPEAERYKRAYQIATELTSHMGFTGFRLQLQIEKAGNLIALGELRPKLIEALEKAMGKNEALRKLREFDQLTGQ